MIFIICSPPGRAICPHNAGRQHNGTSTRLPSQTDIDQSQTDMSQSKADIFQSAAPFPSFTPCVAASSHDLSEHCFVQTRQPHCGCHLQVLSSQRPRQDDTNISTHPDIHCGCPYKLYGVPHWISIHTNTSLSDTSYIHSVSLTGTGGESCM